MNIDRQSQEQLAGEVEDLAAQAISNHRLGESYIIRSNAALIRSNARVEGNIGNLINMLKKFNNEARKQAEASDLQSKKTVRLTLATTYLTLLLFIGLIIQIILAIITGK